LEAGAFRLFLKLKLNDKLFKFADEGKFSEIESELFFLEGKVKGNGLEISKPVLEQHPMKTSL
jgi:hypothetical protein